MPRRTISAAPAPSARTDRSPCPTASMVAMNAASGLVTEARITSVIATATAIAASTARIRQSLVQA